MSLKLLITTTWITETGGSHSSSVPINATDPENFVTRNSAHDFPRLFRWRAETYSRIHPDYGSVLPGFMFLFLCGCTDCIAIYV